MTYEVEETSADGDWHLPGDIRVGSTQDLYDDLAIALAASALTAVEARGVFHLALSGGSTPEPFYMHLVIDPRYRTIPWQQTHVWIVDERCVPEDDERSNVKMIRHVLTDHVPMKRRQVHPIPAMNADPAGEYEAELARVFAIADEGGKPQTAEPPRLDFVLLGMGDDGHTASLFPHSPALSETQRWVAKNEGASVTPPPRVTMTFPLLNAAREVAILCTGIKKQLTLLNVSDQMRRGGPDVANLPVTGIAPTDGALTWFLDLAAAGE